jgi:CubicO group peptidase (beta-lactamase class C family)
MSASPTALPAGDPAALGFDPQRLARVVRAIDADVEAARYDGAAICVARRGAVALSAHRGFAERSASHALEPSSVFVSMSIGKQFTNALVLQRVERGDLSFTTHVCDLIPEFATRGKRGMQLHQLLTHTSGLMAAVPALPPEQLASIEALAAFAARSTPESLPGQRVNYSIGVAHSVLAEMVRRADGGKRSFARIVAEDLFTPLGMRETSLGSRADLVPRVCPVVARFDEPGLFEAQEIEMLGVLMLMEGAELPAGGYLTTLGDVVRFAEMLRRGGELDGARVLSPSMIEFASRNHTGDKPNELLGYTVGMRDWPTFPATIGLGFFVRGDGVIPGPFGNLNSRRTFGGWGAGSTAFWIDPERELTFSFLSTGLLEDSRHIERISRLSDMVVSAIVD